MYRTPRVALAIAALGLTAACGGSELPSKAEFVDRVSKSVEEAQGDQLAQAGVDADEVGRIVDRFAGCVYDEIKDDEKLLEAAFDESGAAGIEDEMRTRSGACISKMQESMTKAIAASQGSGS